MANMANFNLPALGQSGASYHFQFDPVGTSYNPYAGVYMFVRHDQAFWRCLYIGQTGNFNQRLNVGLLSHHVWPRLSQAGATHVGTLRVLGSEEQRLAIERDLILALRPTFNS